MEDLFFPYGEKEMEYLSKKDKKLGKIIAEMGFIKREVNPDLFASLISSIVSQQISNKARDTVWSRMEALFGEITPETVRKTDILKIQQCGISMRKAQYIKGVAESDIDFETLRTMSDGEVISRLSALCGVGVWTAEMLLIFSLQRPDVVSYGDLAIRRGMMTLYGKDRLDKKEFEKYQKRYSPYGTVASLYLWQLSH